MNNRIFTSSACHTVEIFQNQLYIIGVLEKVNYIRYIKLIKSEHFAVSCTDTFFHHFFQEWVGIRNTVNSFTDVEKVRCVVHTSCRKKTVNDCLSIHICKSFFIKVMYQGFFEIFEHFVYISFVGFNGIYIKNLFAYFTGFFRQFNCQLM